MTILTLMLLLLSTWCQAQNKEYWEDGSLKAEGYYAENGLKKGKWKFYYPNGQLEAEGQYLPIKAESVIEIVKRNRNSAIDDEQSTRDGEWIFYFENGKLKSKGTYANGCPKGIVSRWHSNGQKAEESEYFNCRPQGNRKMWDRDGKLYFENRLEGDGRSVEIEWYANGQKKSEIPYKDGQQFGKVLRWYPNGQKEEEVMMKNTRVHGHYRSWYENGQKQREFFSINNIMSGEYREWNEAGKLIIEIIEQPTQKTIAVKNYWDNGAVKLDGTSKLPASLSIHQWNQTRHGEWTYFSQDGRIQKTEKYVDGKLTSTVIP